MIAVRRAGADECALRRGEIRDRLKENARLMRDLRTAPSDDPFASVDDRLGRLAVERRELLSERRSLRRGKVL